MHIDAITRRTRRSADTRNRPRRSLVAPTGADFSQLLDELSVWLDTSSFDDFNDVLTALTEIADAADATGSEIDTINFTIGVDACKFSINPIFSINLTIKNDILDIK